MSLPLDHLVEHRTGLVRLARLFSNVVSPPVIFAVLALTLALHAAPLGQALVWAAVYGFVVSLLPILFVLWMLRTGRIEELHMSNTSERHLPYLVAVLCGGFMYVLLAVFAGPDVLRCLAIFNMITLALLGLINARWLISFHTTAISAALVFTVTVFGWLAGLVVVPLVIVVAAVRLYLRRHNAAQVVAGLVLGTACALGLTLTGCFG